MKILFLTQYFPPETGAPQNRIFSIAKYLSESGETVTVMTAMPNYPNNKIFKEYRGSIFKKEKIGSITILRSWIFTSKNTGVFIRLLNYFSFVVSSLVIGIIKLKKQDVIICESPPLFLGITALIIKWLKKAKLVFNVSDLWPESAEKLKIIDNKLLLNIAYKLEAILYRKSSLVSCQTNGICKNINLRFPNVNTYWLRNGIDFECLYTDSIFQNFREQKGLSADDYILVYTGLIGYAQGLEVIIKSAEILKDHLNIRFFIAGEGPERIKLIKMAKEKSLDNVEFLPNLPHKQALNIISSCDAAIVPLKNNPLFRGAIPSKLFEPLAFGKPIILGVDGEARDIFINKGGCGLYFEPENAFELATCIMKLVNDRSLGKRLGENGKRYVVNEFDRKKIATDFNEVLLRLFNN